MADAPSKHAASTNMADMLRPQPTKVSPRVDKQSRSYNPTEKSAQCIPGSRKSSRMADAPEGMQPAGWQA